MTKTEIRNWDAYNLSEIQKDYKDKPCPNCDVGRLYPVESSDKEKNTDFDCLWCDMCDLSMDDSGGYVV